MKKILIILLLILISLIVVGQNEVDTCFTKEEMITLANKIKTSQHNDSIQKIIIEEKTFQIRGYKSLLYNDSLMMDGYKQQIQFLREQNDIYKKFQRDTKPKWYDSKLIWYVMGAASILAGSWALNNTIN